MPVLCRGSCGSSLSLLCVFSDDSDAYIQYLSYVIGAVTGERPVVWATRELGVPLGIPSIFLYDGLETGDISAGGGQLYTCRDAARVGQLIASGGVWADADGNEMRLMSSAFAKGFVQPSFPDINPACKSEITCLRNRLPSPACRPQHVLVRAPLLKFCQMDSSHG
jgi:hypothetical protein